MTVLDAYPFDQGVGSNSGQVRWQKIGKLWSANGVVPQSVTGLSGELASTFSAGSITVQPGGVVINGTYGEMSTSTTIPAGANGLLVARLDNTNYQLIITFNQGASTPVQTPTTWELPLALLTGTTLADQRSFANPRTAFPVAPASGFHSFVDPQGVTWVSYGGSAWKRSTDSLVGRVYAATTVQDVPPGAWTKLTNWDTVDTDAYHCWDGTNKNWIIPSPVCTASTPA
jgi:hypothetical protein